jgi:hypothetical protein
MLSRWLGALVVALASGSAVAQSVSGPVALAPSADCQAAASVTWSFTYTVNPAREFGRVTNVAGTVIGGFVDTPSRLSGGSFNGTWTQPITLPQLQPNTLIGSYGWAGDVVTAANTVEFFILYNCTTRQVIYHCSGNLGSCPTTAAQGLARISEPIPMISPGTLAVLLLTLIGTGAYLLRRRAEVPAQVRPEVRPRSRSPCTADPPHR